MTSKKTGSSVFRCGLSARFSIFPGKIVGHVIVRSPKIQCFAPKNGRAGDWYACDDGGLNVERILSDSNPMTEEDWVVGDHQQKMLALLVSRHASERKLRLFACACCRRIWNQYKRSEPSRRAVEVAERYADGQATEGELHIAKEAAQNAWAATRMSVVQGQARRAATYAASKNIEQLAYTATAAYMGVFQSREVEVREAAQQAERNTIPERIRCVFDNPFRPVTLNPAWQTPNVVALATAAYDERIMPSGTLDTARLAVLADALEEAGCGNEDILNHLRQTGVHVRGCWVVDLILGKE